MPTMIAPARTAAELVSCCIAVLMRWMRPSDDGSSTGRSTKTVEMRLPSGVLLVLAAHRDGHERDRHPPARQLGSRDVEVGGEHPGDGAEDRVVDGPAGGLADAA